MILSLQGCMAVGKTTAVRYLQENAPYINISYESNTDIIDEVRRRQLDKNKYIAVSGRQEALYGRKARINRTVIKRS